MRRMWFRRWGLIYLPHSLIGWSVTVLTLAIAARTFIMVDNHSHSVSDTLIGAVPIIAVMLVLLWLLAARSSER